MTTTVGELNIPDTYDLDFIRGKIGQTLGWATVPGDIPGHVKVVMAGADMARAAALVDSYPVDYLAVALPKKLAALSAERDRRLQAYPCQIPGGPVIPIPITVESKVDMAGTREMLKERPNKAGVNWSLGGGNTIFIPRDMAIDVSLAMAEYISDHFDAYTRLVGLAKAAPNITALAAIDETADASWT